jgi:rubrerythrin
MAEEEGQTKRNRRIEKGSLFHIRRSPPEEQEVACVTVKEEKKHLRRVVKTGPMRRKHMSESLEAEKVDAQQIKITEEVLKGISFSAEEPPKKVTDSRTFTCFVCGGTVSITAERCTHCDARYIRDIPPEAIAEMEAAESDAAFVDEPVIKRDRVPCIHFSPESGIMNILEDDNREPDFVTECDGCGTLVEFSTDRCPICGKIFEAADSGLVAVFKGMEFDKDCSGEMDCPLCGEVITPRDGKCTACGELVHADNPKDPSSKVEPLIHNDNVVFMHLDVESGEVNYLQRLMHKFGFEQVTVQLEGIGRAGFEHEGEWKGLSRM